MEKLFSKYLKVLIGILIGLLIGWLLAPLGNPVTNFSEKYIFHKNPDLRVTLTSVYFVNRNNTFIIDLPKTLGYQVVTDESGNKEIIGLGSTPGTFSWMVIGNSSLIIFPNFPTFITKMIDSNNTEYALIVTCHKEERVVMNEQYHFFAYFDWDHWLKQKQPRENVIQNTIAVYNLGNKEIKDLRIWVSSINEMVDVTGTDDFWMSLDDMGFEIRRDSFLEDDRIEGRFILKLPKDNSGSFVKFEDKEYRVLAWSECQVESLRNLNVDACIDQKEIDDSKIWQILVIIIPNCHSGW